MSADNPLPRPSPSPKDGIRIGQVSHRIWYLALLINIFVFIFMISNVSRTSAVKSTKYYDTLGISPSATIAQIKQAYRRLSIKLHPDRNKEEGAASRFAEIAQAYEILSDEGKRRIYDEAGEEGLKQEEQGGAGSEHDIFSFLNPFGFGPRRRNQKEKAESTEFKLYLTLEQLYFGEMLQVQFKRPVICPRFNDCVITKRSCSGPGTRTITQRLNQGFIIQNQISDETCVDREKGFKSPCKACPEGASELHTATTSIFVEPGMADGDLITASGLGIEKTGYEPGDLIFKIVQLPDSSYTRNGDNLETTVYLNLLQSLTGFEESFKHINGEILHLNKKDVVHDGQVEILAGWGMPSKDDTGFGHLKTTYRVQYPITLDDESQELIKQALLNVTQWKFETPQNHTYMTDYSDNSEKPLTAHPGRTTFQPRVSKVHDTATSKDVSLGWESNDTPQQLMVPCTRKHLKSFSLSSEMKLPNGYIQKLERTIRLFEVYSSPQILEYEDFLSDSECNKLLDLAESVGWEPSKTSTGAAYGKQQRTSNFLKVPPERLEGLNILRYSPGQQFKTHHDGDFRPYSLVLYLNDVDLGGETQFPNINFTLKPKRGRAVCWSNILEDGKADLRTLHAGCPVLKGVKYCIPVFVNRDILRVKN